MAHARRTIVPNLPEDQLDVHDFLSSIKIETNQKENFVLVNDKANNIIMFSTIKNLTLLKSLTTIFVDGTFYSCPKQFGQVFTIFGLHKNLYIPLASFLLIGKQINSYATAFYYLISECKKINLDFDPKSVFVDFELAIHSAIREVFPNSNIKGCRFHLGQSWWRKIQEFGLAVEYKDKNSEIGSFLKNFFGLAFLNSFDVENCFVEDLMALQPLDARVEKFCDYILENYIQSDSSFPPNIWAAFSPTTTRTTNGCESYHKELNSMFYTPKPNISLFVEALLDVQIDVYIKMRSTGKRRKEILEKEELLKNYMLLLQSGSLSRFEFVRNVSRKFLPV